MKINAMKRLKLSSSNLILHFSQWLYSYSKALFTSLTKPTIFCFCDVHILPLALYLMLPETNWKAPTFLKSTEPGLTFLSFHSTLSTEYIKFPCPTRAGALCEKSRKISNLEFWLGSESEVRCKTNTSNKQE